jgi:HK97 family phage prohead protease
MNEATRQAMAELNRELSNFSLQPHADSTRQLSIKRAATAVAELREVLADSSKAITLRHLNRELAAFSLAEPDKPLLEVKRSATGTQVRGYAAVFGTVDQQGEVIDPGAFSESLAHHRRKGTQPLMFWSHDPAEIPGYWTSMVEDHKGLLATGRILSTVQRGKEALALIDAGAVSGLSVGFRCKRDKMIGGIRHLQNLDLVEVSLVSLPSNDAARIAIVGMEL